MKWILVVDDEPHVTRLMRTRLERSGFRVEVAPNGEAALEKLEHRAFDAIVTDITMPRMTGQELCEEVRKRGESDEPAILVVSSRAQSDIRDWASAVPNLRFMEKPISLVKLVQTLEALLGPVSGEGEA